MRIKQENNALKAQITQLQNELKRAASGRGGGGGVAAATPLKPLANQAVGNTQQPGGGGGGVEKEAAACGGGEEEETVEAVRARLEARLLSERKQLADTLRSAGWDSGSSGGSAVAAAAGPEAPLATVRRLCAAHASAAASAAAAEGRCRDHERENRLLAGEVELYRGMFERSRSEARVAEVS